MPKKTIAGPTTAPQKKRSIPKVYADTKGAWQGIGSFRFTENAGVLSAHWAASSGQEVTAVFCVLCNDPALAKARLELGELVGNIAERAAQSALRAFLTQAKQWLKQADCRGRRQVGVIGRECRRDI